MSQNKEQNFLNAVLNNIEDGIVACNNEGVLTLFNRATKKFHGLPQEALSADKWSEHYNLYMADGKTQMQRKDIPLFRALKEEKVQDVEMVIAPKNGPNRILLASGQALYDHKGAKIGAVVSMHDITERKKAEELLRKSHDTLEKKVKERVKELRCLQNISEIVERKGEELEKILLSVVKIIPPSWQYPEITCVRIKIKGDVYLSEKFHQTQWVQSQDVYVHSKSVGKLEVFYLEEKPNFEEGPFLKEERNLINIIAERLGRIVERIEAEQKRKKAEMKKDELIEKLQKALGEIKTLRGIIPICSYCKKIRDDKGAWEIIEAYISKHSDAQFSHGACPECYKKQMEELENEE